MSEMMAKASARLGSFELWFYGLISGFIGGGATALTAAAGLGTAHASGMDVPTLNLKAMGIVFVSSGIWTAMSYLAKSPLPPITVITERTVTNSQTEKTTVAVTTDTTQPSK